MQKTVVVVVVAVVAVVAAVAVVHHHHRLTELIDSLMLLLVLFDATMDVDDQLLPLRPLRSALKTETPAIDPLLRLVLASLVESCPLESIGPV